MRPPLPATVLMDLDDTIFDHALTCRAAISKLRARHPYLRRVGLEAQWQEYLRLLEAVHPEVLAGRRTSDEVRAERWSRISHSCGATLSAQQAERLSTEYRRAYQSLRRPVPGALALLERWHTGTKIVIVTNNEVAEQEEKLRFIGADKFVDDLVVSQAVGAWKPDPRIFEVALERARARPQETVMIGDSWASDVRGALAVGIRPIWFNRFHRALPEPSNVAEFDRYRPFVRLESLLPGRIISDEPLHR